MNVHLENIIANLMPTALTLKDLLIVIARRDILEMDGTVKVRQVIKYQGMIFLFFVNL